MRAIFFLVVLLLAAGGAYLYLNRMPGVEERSDIAITPEAAETARVKMDRLQSDLEEISLTESELSSLIAYRPEVWELGMIESPVIRMSGDTMTLSGTVSPGDLPEAAGLNELRAILPDTVRVHVAGTVGPFAGADAIINIAGVEVAGLPFPSRFFPDIVERLGLPARDDIPESAFVLPLPRGIGAARVSGGVLVLSP